MKHRSLSVLLSLISLLFVACSDSDNTFTSSPPAHAAQVAQAATIRLTQPLLRAVPQEVTQQRFSGFDSKGSLLYGPLTRPKAATIELENVSTAVTRLQIEYLQGDTVIGLGSVEVALVIGEVFEVTNPPFQDVVSALSALQVTPGGSTIADGSAQQFSVVGTFADNTQVDLTSSATWSSSNTAAATIAPGGLATGVDPGETTITATVGPVSNSTTLTVSFATISTIDVTPNAPSIAGGTQQQFTATANLSDGGTQDVTATATWASSSTNVARIGADTGLAEGQGNGQTTISATVGDVAGSTSLNVSSAGVTSLVISPGNQTIAEGTNQQFTVTANFSSGPSQDVTSSANWTSSLEGVATITSPGGLATAVASGGPTNISASFGGETASTNLTVSDAEIASIEVTPANPLIADGTEQQFTATATLTSGAPQDVTATATWTSSSTATATIQTSADTTPGLALAVDPGQTTVTAAVGEVSGTTTLSVTQASVESIEVTPANPTSANGTDQQFTVIATLSDTSTQDVTSSAQWNSGTPGVATITNPGGLAEVVADSGTTVIEASFGGETGSTTLTASAAILESITINPDPAIVPNGENVNFTAIGSFSDGSTPDITNSVTWSSGDTDVATIVMDTGVAAATGAGNTEITATQDGVTGTATIVGINLILESIAVEPPEALSSPGSTRQYRAIGTFDDGSTRDLTSQVTWSSSDANVVIGNDDVPPNKVGAARVSLTAPTGTEATITASLGLLTTTSHLRLNRFAYTANGGTDSSNVSAFLINDDGTLTTNGDPTDAGNAPRTITVDPSGRFVYIGNFNSRDVSAFAINPDGTLTPIGSVDAASTPNSIVVDPRGRFVYTADFNSDNLSAYVINADGTLTSNGTTDTGEGPASVTVHPNSRFAYVTNFDSNNVSAFVINADGTLTPNGTTGTGTRPISVIVEPSGRFAYIANVNSDNVSAFIINADGTLTANGTIDTVASPWSVTVDPSGRFVYIGSSGPANVSAFTINADGTLTANGAPTGVDDNAFSVTVDASGRFVYATNQFLSSVSAYLINPDGTLTANGTIIADSFPEEVVTTP